MDLLALGLAIWAYVLSRHPDAPRWLRLVPAGLVVNWLGTGAATAWQLRAAFAAVNGVAPHEKQARNEGGLDHR